MADTNIVQGWAHIDRHYCEPPCLRRCCNNIWEGIRSGDGWRCPGCGNWYVATYVKNTLDLSWDGPLSKSRWSGQRAQREALEAKWRAQSG